VGPDQTITVGPDGVVILTLSAHWFVVAVATIGLLLTLGFSQIALSPKRQDTHPG